MAKLQPLLAFEGLYARALVEFPAPIRFGDEQDEAALDEMFQGQSPCIVVSLGRRQYEGRSTDLREWSGEIQLHILVIVKHQRSLMSPLKGDAVSDSDATKDPGAEVLLDHVFDRLAGTQISVSPDFTTHLRPDTEEPVLFGETWIVWEQQYTAHFSRDTNPERDNTARVVEVEVFHDSVDGPADRIEVDALTPLEEP